MTLKTGVMMLKIHSILKYIKIKKRVILNCNNILQYYDFNYIFLSSKYSFGQHKSKTLNTKTYKKCKKKKKKKEEDHVTL